MSCLVNRNNEGKIINVKTPQGEDSKLFQAIHSNIFMGDAESSVKILSAAYSPEMEGRFESYDTGEPKLYLRSSVGNEFQDLEEMLISGETGTTTMGFKDAQTGAFTPIAKFDTEHSEKNVFLRDQVQQGILSADRVLQIDGVTRFQGKGEYTETKKAMAFAAKFEAIMDLGNGRTKVNKDGTFELEFPLETTIVEYNEETKVIDIKDVPKEFRKATNKVELATQYALVEKAQRGTSEPVKQQETKVLLDSLYSFLNSMGFTTSTLEEYRNNYNTKYGKDPDILAVSDMANRVVALAQGVDVTQEMTEEVAHIAIDAYSEQSSIASALASVHLTPEYTEHSEYYTEKYSAFYEGIELEDKVRKEILGKVLARQIREKFESKDSQTLTNKLKDIFTKFIEAIQSIFRPHHAQSLNRLVDSIAESVLQEDYASFDKAFESDNFFYSAMSSDNRKIEIDLQATKRSIEAMFSRILKQTSPQQAELDRIAEEMNDNDILSSVNTITGITKNQVTVLESVVEEANKRGEIIDEINGNRYNHLTERIFPLLGKLKMSLDTRDFKTQKEKDIANKIAETIKELNSRMADIHPRMEIHNENNVNRILDRSLNELELTDDQKEEVRKGVQGGMRDISWFSKMFGLITHSSNPLLQLIAKLVAQMNVRVNNRFKTEVDSTVSEIYEKGLEKHQKGIVKKEGGKKTYFYMSPIDWTKYESDLKNVQVAVLSEITGMTTDEVNKKLETVQPTDLLTNADDILKYRAEVKKWKDTDGVERRFKDKYYEDRDKRYEKANISDSTRTYIENKNASNFTRNRRFFRPDGAIDKTTQEESEKLEDINAYQSHLSVKSAYDQFGNIREGLKRVSPKDLTTSEINALHFSQEIKDYLLSKKNDFTGEITVLADNYDVENLSEDARLSLDLGALDIVYRQEFENGEKGLPSEKFFKALQNAEAIGEGLNFLSANTSMNISSKYYESLGTSINYNTVAQQYVNSIEVVHDRNLKQAILTDLIDLQRSRKELLKQFKQMRSPINTDVKNMQSTVRDRILELDDDISKRRKDLALPAEYYDKMSKFNSSAGLTDDFYKMSTESPLSFEDFCLKHMTKANRFKYEDFSRDIVDFAKERKTTVKKQYVDFVAKIQRSGLLDNVADPNDKIAIYKREFAKQGVASYFQRYEPAGYTEAIDAIRNGSVNLSDLFTSKESLIEEYPALEYIEFAPDYSWLEETLNEDYINPNFKPGYYLQPKLDKYIDKEFFNRYGVSVEDFKIHGHDLNRLSPTKNKEEYELLVMMTNLREKSATLYGDKETMNKYLLPQQSKDGIEKVFSTIGSSAKKNIKESFKDMFSNRIDDQDYGDVALSDTDMDIKLVPKYFQQKLDDPSLITDSIIQSALIDFKEAIRYEERTGIERDIKSLEKQIAAQRFDNGTNKNKQRIAKKGEVSNYYEKTVEYTDYHLYGIKQSRQFEVNILGQRRDITRAINTVQGVMRFSNLAFNPLIDITSATTGVLNNVMDRVAGDYYHKSSANRANSTATKLMGSYILETSKVNKKSKLNHIMEFFQINEVESRLQNTAFGRGIRFMDKSPYALSKLANAPVTPKVLLSILMDYRMVDGKFRSWTDFYTYKKNEDKKLSKTEIEALWSQLKDSSLYDYLDITENGINYNDKFKKAFPKEPRKQFEAIQERVVQKSKQVIQNVDGVLNETDQVAAQRDVLTNMFMMHRGWLLINLTKRFKKQHLNLATGQVEEGHYITLMNFLGSVLKKRKTGESMAQIVEGMTTNQKKNLKRVVVETGFGIFLLALGEAVIGSDDDDDEYMENLMQLVYLRTVSEYNSAQFYSMHGSLIETLKSPIVAMKTVEDAVKVPGKFIGGEDGAGLNQLMKITIAKRANQIGSTDALQKQIESYRHFNDLTLFNLAAGK